MMWLASVLDNVTISVTGPYLCEAKQIWRGLSSTRTLFAAPGSPLVSDAPEVTT